jgi:2-aminobenzoate-CoA ligase
VEDALLHHPDVAEAAVVSRPAALREQIVVAYDVLREGVPTGEDTVAALTRSVKRQLTPYKCPHEIVFLHALPRTPTGKLQRFRLRALE